MLDTERQPEPESSDEGSFAAVLDEVDQIEIEPAAPAEEAAPSAEQPEGTPAEAPAPEGETTPAETDAAARPEGEVPAADAPAAESGETPTTETPVEIELDGKKLVIAEARVDKGRGDKIVLPRTALETVLKTQVQDAVGRERTNFGRERVGLQRQLQALQQEKGAAEHTAGELLAELDRIMEADDATSFDEWERMRSGYRDRKAKAEAEYWKAKATGHTESATQAQYEEQMREFVPVLQQNLRKWTEEAVGTVKDQLPGLAPEEVQAFTEQLYEMLLDDADAGRIFIHTGEKIQGTLLPKLNVNFQRIATVVEREVGRTRKTLDLVAKRDTELKALRDQMAKIEAAAKQNAAADVRRKGGAGAPPPVSGKPGSATPSKAAEPKSFDDILAEVDQL
jgi:hypothetical protein